MTLPPFIIRTGLSFFSCAFILSSTQVAAQTPPPTNILVQDGQKVVFMGDSITGMGWSVPGGYVKLVVSGLEALGIKVVPIPAGVGGNTSREMLARLDKDALSLKPDWLLLSCGVNDVWGRGIDLDTFKKNITSIVDQAQTAGIKVMILTPTPIYERADSEFSQKLPAYVAFMVQLARDRKLPLADLHAAYFTYLNAQPPDPTNNTLTIDGVHPNPDGHLVMAQGVLEAFGVTPEQMAKVKEAWLAAADDANVSCDFGFRGNVPITLGQYETLKKVAAERKVTVGVLIHGVYMESIRDALIAHGDLSTIHQDNISTEAQPIFRQKIEALVK